MSYVTEEIASQPSCWRRAAQLAPGMAGILPRHGQRVAVLGCGTSHYVAQAYAARRESSGRGETDAMAASEWRPGRHYDHVVAISRSGTTTEILAALDRIGATIPTTAVTADGDTPAARAANAHVALDFAQERSVVQTRFATSTLVLLFAHLGVETDDLVAQAAEAVAEPLTPHWLEVDRYTFIGTGWSIGVANEAALKLRETSRSWTESYSAMELRHGPISVVDQDSLVWSFGPAPAGLATEVAATGAELVDSGLDPLADLIRAQRLGVALAGRRGFDPDRPRHLSRSVILSPLPRP